MRKQTAVRGIELLLLALLAALLAWATALERQQQAISGSVIRLHVVANSDTQQDQTVKLQVRDAVLALAGELLRDADSQMEARAILRAHLPELEAAANAVLVSGAGQTAAVTLRRELFGVRDYDGFSLPGGYYDALRVTLGAGEGRNWWCVVYPQICTAATAEDRETVAVMGGMDREQLAVLKRRTPEYELKFRSLELLEDILGWFRGGKDGIPAAR